MTAGTPRSKGRTGRPWRRIRANILANNDTCWLCGAPGADTIDHITPLSLGGDPRNPANLRPAHATCNSRRGNKPPNPQPGSRQW